MKKKRLLWQIFPPMIIVTIAAVIGATFYASSVLKELYLDQTREDLTIRTQLVVEQLYDEFASGNHQRLVSRCREVAAQVQARITLILPNGEVIADSVENPVRMDNHADREEIAAALKGERGRSLRFSRTLGKNMLYSALPVIIHTGPSALPENLYGVVRLSIPLVSITTVLHKIYWEFFLGAVVLLLFSSMTTFFLSRRISSPLEEMGRAAERFGRLDLSRKIVFSEKDAISLEVAGLAEAINKMATELHERIDTVTNQKNELEAVFKSMVEGVIVVDPGERILRANDTVSTLFNIPAKKMIGRSVTETFRDADFSRFVRETLAGDHYLERDLVFDQIEGERYLHAGGTVLYDGSGKRVGALAVLYDITRTKKLENMRSEFVANVSHELKTPITAIKGFVETLLDGALENGEDAGKFLEIIQKQANRLNAIVDDLLSLSRIEQDEKQNEIELQEHSLCPVLENCLEACAMKARGKKIALKLDCGPRIMVPMNQRLLEQAITNLLVNAIKYSSEESDVQINASHLAKEIHINIIDHGCGIAREHLPRLFERFYRSDKARSRKLGGTGLGLAIAKHIIQAHGGDIAVKSEPGKGSTFTIILPIIS
ncbi:MAG: cell wall metabolism sensor histidine kinase WalK [Proteobacteria bacterium]|nr:cell wall metabolism sensor histidine kinase WalK [Pseudomonadota bacterium]MBU1708732.1 cell wall metabolism sensor histidine kinase WalK [Pseudomonadota bacterium]